MSKRIFWLLAFAAIRIALSQEIDTAVPAGQRASSNSLFDEIQNTGERGRFRELRQTRDAATQKQRALAFLESYPASIVLKEAYEIAARSSVALGQNAEGLQWAERSLRLLPENPFLLAMTADIAAGQKQYDLAERSAREALRELERAAAPSPISEAAWPKVRDDLRETAYFALGRAAAARGRNAEGGKWLLAALTLNSRDAEALYVLGLVRVAEQNESEAAPCFAQVMNGPAGPLADAARRSLQRIYERDGHPGTFEQFAASLRWIAPSPPQPEKKVVAADHYAGSAACRECHSRQFGNWQETGMAKMFRPYREEDVIGDFSGQQTVAGAARAMAEKDRRFIELRDSATGAWTRYGIDFVIGSKWQQAYASRLPDGELVVLPIQYSRIERAWVNYWKIVDGGLTSRSDIGNFHGAPPGALYQRDCAPCHTSQLRDSGGTERPAAVSFLEGGVDCEMCHGPSLAHVAAMRQASAADPSRYPTAPPVDFRKISAQESVAICAQCHMQTAIHEPQPAGAVNYSADGGPFYRTYRVHLLSDFTRRATYADGRFRATTFIVEAFTRSRCFRDGNATCVSCHDVHPDDAAANPKSLRFAPGSDEMCLQCHQSLRDRPERHTHHAAGTEASHCVSCHMPRTMDAVLFRARSHQIDEIPDAEMTSRFGKTQSPNACLDCHRDRDTAWLTGQMRLWKREP